MFKKSSNSRLESLIGSNSGFRGDVDAKGTLRIDGTFEGNIAAEHVIVGEKAYIKGNITANGITIGGKVEGNLESKGLVEIAPKGFVSGDILTARLAIAEGGTYSGRVLMDENKSNVVEFQAKDN
ncbi:MAG: polymer-forming cytoskeletal protein [Proteobacteria bacterium]|nr:polymer-forming cytoskeletal protein [Pseudomonadota bacterium]